jgi:preprotein translocase subunit SecE
MSRYRKYIDLGLGLAALALWFVLRQMFDQVWEVFRLPLFEQSPIQLPTLIALVLAFLAFIFARSNHKVFNFLDEVATELSKVSWPTSQETITSTGVIVVMVGIAALILFGFDAIWGTLTNSFLTL